MPGTMRALVGTAALLVCLGLASAAEGGDRSDNEITKELADPNTAQAQDDGGSFWEGFIDPEDGYLDLSDWLMERHGFLPVPVLITEPAVGPGGGLSPSPQ